MTERYVHVEGDRLWSEALGDPADPPILLIAGGNLCSRSWPEPLVERLVDGGARVIRYDHRGTGRSTTRDVTARPYTYDELSADPLAVLDAWDVPAAHVVAVSMGATMAQLTALDHPERLLGLTLMMGGALDVDFDGDIERAFNGEPPTGSLPLPRQPLLDVLELMSHPVEDSKAELRRRVEKWRLLSGGEVPFDQDEFLNWERRAIEHSGRVIESMAHHSVPPPPTDRAGELAGLRVPTLVVQAMEDPVAPPPHGRHLADLVPGARLLEVPRMGHALTGSVHALLAETIIDHTVRSSRGQEARLEGNKLRALAMVAAWNRGDVDGVVAFWARDAVHHDEDGGRMDGQELERIMRDSLESFPDLRLDAKSVVAEGDRVMLRITTTATHKGEFMGVPPTGRRVTWHYLEELRFNDVGQVVEHWDVFNFSPLYRELGSVPAGL